MTINNDPTVPPAQLNTIGSIQVADYQCTASAANAGLVPGWNGLDIVYKAILSTSSEDARDHVNVTGPVFNRNGGLVATGEADLWDGLIDSAVGYDEFSFPINSDFDVFTGTNSDGTASFDTCDDWSNGLAQSEIGLTNSDAFDWISSTSVGCSVPKRIYCLSNPITP